MAIKHKFSSEIPDGLDPKLVKPSDWNEDHFVDFEGLAKSVGGVLLKAVDGIDYLRPDGSGASLTGITAAQVGLGNVTNESKPTMFTSPVFTGIPTGPTAPVDTNSTQLATTEFFAGQAGAATPLAPAVTAVVGTAIKFAREDHRHPTNFTATLADIKMNGTQALGSLTTFCRADHVHPTDTSRAPVASPTFTGVVTGPQFVSTMAAGTAPLVVSSTTMVTNLNAQYLGGTALSGLSPVSGSTSIVTLGTVTTGTWNATTIGTNKGGTGLTSFTANGAVYATSTSALTTGTLPVAAGGTGVTTSTGTGSNVLSTSPTLTTPNIGVATGTSFNSITGLASVAPLAPAVTAEVGTSTLAARQDHVHPTNFTATATDIKMNGTQAVGVLTTFPRADHVHPTDTSRQATLVSGTNIKTINGTTLLGSGDLSIPALTDGAKGDITVGSGGTTLTVTEPTLAALKNVTTAADKMIYATGVDTFSTATLTAFARTLLDDTSAAAMLATLGAQAAATAINTSNIGSQSVNYAASAGNADTLDGYHAASFLSSGSFSQAFSASGYQRLPSGLIIQWGTATTPLAATTGVTLPIAFPTANVASFANGNGSSGDKNTTVSAKSTTSISIFNGDNGASTCSWLAIGY